MSRWKKNKEKSGPNSENVCEVNDQHSVETVSAF